MLLPALGGPLTPSFLFGFCCSIFGLQEPSAADFLSAKITNALNGERRHSG